MMATLTSMDKKDRRGIVVAVALGVVLPTAVALALLWLSPRPIPAPGATAGLKSRKAHHEK
jgi:hypothetical protein